MSMMEIPLEEDLAMQCLRGRLSRDEPLARLTSWRVGGVADCLYRPADLEDLTVFLGRLPADEPLFWLGLGSNLLIRDGGIRGTVILTQGCLQSLSITANGRIRAEAGVACAKVARFASRQDLVGAEFLAGIPGTIGGALAMNAGAWGGETWSVVKGVETVSRDGEVLYHSPEEFEIAYRHVSGPAEEWFVAAHIELGAGDGKASALHIRELLDKRSTTQPTGVASCGSVFRNPANNHAARLIEAAGLKGTRIGGAQVSEKHANFIINTGTARAADMEALIQQVQELVFDAHGVRLMTEVKIVGESKGISDE